MTIELTLLGWSMALALLQTLLPAILRTREVGLPYAAGPRDTPPPVPPGKLTGRFIRAQHNLLETLPVFAALVLIASIAKIATPLTYWGTMLYFWSRVAYLPLYALGIPYVRTLTFFSGVAGLVCLLIAVLG